MARDGWMFVLPLLVSAIVCMAVSRWWGGGWIAAGATMLVLAGYCAYFFRDPARKAPEDPLLVVSPADGRVISVKRVDDPYVGKNAIKVDIFLNIFNVHIQRNPFCRPAKVDKVSYHPGKFLAADHPKASLDNEQNWMCLDSQGDRIQVRQIAGLIARRIACWVAPGEELGPIAQLGLIRFGSQVDIILPSTAEVTVAPGQHLAGGESVVARLQKRRGRPRGAATAKPAKKAARRAKK